MKAKEKAPSVPESLQAEGVLKWLGEIEEDRRTATEAAQNLLAQFDPTLAEFFAKLNWADLDQEMADFFTALKSVSERHAARFKEIIEGDKGNSHFYTGGGMGDAKDLNAVAARLRIPLDVAERYLERVAAEAARETTGRAKARLRLKWEKARRAGETPPDFIKRAYAAELAAGTLHKGVIRSEDGRLYDALFNWLRDPAHKLDFELPTKQEWNTRQLEQRGDDPALREAMRLHEVARRRARSARSRSPA